MNNYPEKIDSHFSEEFNLGSVEIILKNINFEFTSIGKYRHGKNFYIHVVHTYHSMF